MKAFKTFASVPEDQRPAGIPLLYPSQVKESNDRAADEAAGYIVLDNDVYDAYVLEFATEMEAWHASQAQAKLQNSIEELISAAIQFGHKTVVEFAAENVLLGITQLGMTSPVRAATAKVVSALSTGSLYDAIGECRAIPAEQKDLVFVTDIRLLQFINKIEAYLGLPLSTEL